MVYKYLTMLSTNYAGQGVNFHSAMADWERGSAFTSQPNHVGLPLNSRTMAEIALPEVPTQQEIKSLNRALASGSPSGRSPARCGYL